MELGVVLWKEDRTPNVQELQQRMEEEGFAVFQWTDPAGSIYQPHSHGHDESIWLVDGSITFEISGNDYPLSPGDRLFLPKNTLHSARVPRGQTAEYLIGHK